MLLEEFRIFLEDSESGSMSDSFPSLKSGIDFALIAVSVT